MITAVGIALGNGGVGVCEESDIDGDGRVGIAELIQSVSSAIAGCIDQPLFR